MKPNLMLQFDIFAKDSANAQFVRFKLTSLFMMYAHKINLVNKFHLIIQLQYTLQNLGNKVNAMKSNCEENGIHARDKEKKL